MRKSLYSDSELDRVHNQLADGNAHDEVTDEELRRRLEVSRKNQGRPLRGVRSA
jgi:hypothetical protein